MTTCWVEEDHVYFLAREAMDMHLLKLEGRGRRSARRNSIVISCGLCNGSLISKRINSSKIRKSSEEMSRIEGG